MYTSHEGLPDRGSMVWPALHSSACLRTETCTPLDTLWTLTLYSSFLLRSLVPNFDSVNRIQFWCLSLSS